MRDIKFRAWNEVTEKMLNWNEFLDTNMKNTFIAPESTGLILMQYTGLKDKNGKEIYEGDIVKGTFYGGPMPIYDYIFEIHWNERTKGFMADYFEPTECEVIGNVYDNPELLEEGE